MRYLVVALLLIAVLVSAFDCVVQIYTKQNRTSVQGRDKDGNFRERAID